MSTSQEKMIKKVDLQAFYEEYRQKSEDFYLQYEVEFDAEARRNLLHEIEGMGYILSMLHERFKLG